MASAAKPVSSILVTGGAGYIGTHVVAALDQAGHNVVAFDIATGAGEFQRGDIGDRARVNTVLRDYDIDTVIHLAASTSASESVSESWKYYQNNTIKTHELLRCCEAHGVERFVFASSAAVYGKPTRRCVEDMLTRPISPYGWTKLLSEYALHGERMRHVIFRYFNVAGGRSRPGSPALVSVACEAACGVRSEVPLFGDGSAVRDYIHVQDLANAHVAAIDYLTRGGPSTIINCGLGRGVSVREVLDTVASISDAALPIREVDPRVGDPANVVADNSRLKRLLAWQPRYASIEAIVSDAMRCERDRLAT